MAKIKYKALVNGEVVELEREAPTQSEIDAHNRQERIVEINRQLLVLDKSFSKAEFQMLKAQHELVESGDLEKVTATPHQLQQYNAKVVLVDEYLNLKGEL